MQQPINVIIAGGGTGGHVFPAIAIAKAMKAMSYDINILFVGANGKMEMERVPEAGFEIIGLPISGIQRKAIWKNILIPFRIVKSLLKAKKIVKRFRPDIVIGVGGYASGPVVRAAAGMGIPTLIQEQNSYPGLTNRILSRKAHKICVAYEGMERYFEKSKIILTGNPVRQEVIELEGKQKAAFEYFGMSDDKPVLFITGGSLGARTINEATRKSIGMIAEAGVQVIWQTGRSYLETARNALKESGITGVYVNAFINRMDYAYALAEVVVSRAGAIAVSEISAVKKPAILIPSPNVAEDHQTKNAMALVDQHAAIMIRDDEAEEKMGRIVLDVILNNQTKQRLKENIARMGIRNAAKTIAETAIGLVTGKVEFAQ